MLFSPFASFPVGASDPNAPDGNLAKGEHNILKTSNTAKNFVNFISPPTRKNRRT
jgi:hypothetical protein